SPPPWDVRSPVTGYTVYRGTNSGNRSFFVPLGNVTTYTDTGLANGQRYYYVVTAINAIGEGPPSSEVSAKPATVPGSPGNLQAIPGNGNVTIQWSGAPNNGAPVTSYRVYRGTTSGTTSLVKTLGNVDTYTDTGLTNGVTYYYAVAAVNSIGEGPRSPLVAATPKASGLGTDTIKPSIQILSPVAGASLPAGPTVVTGNASDNVGLALVEVSTDGLNWS